MNYAQFKSVHITPFRWGLEDGIHVRDLVICRGVGIAEGGESKMLPGYGKQYDKLFRKNGVGFLDGQLQPFLRNPHRPELFIPIHENDLILTNQEGSFPIHPDSVKKQYQPIGQVSDGVHSFSSLYQHQRGLFMTLCRFASMQSFHEVWASQIDATGTPVPLGFLLGIDFSEEKENDRYYQWMPAFYWPQLTKGLANVKILPMAPVDYSPTHVSNIDQLLTVDF